MALRLFLSFGLLRFSMDTTLIPLPSDFIFGTPVFDSSIRFSVEKAGLMLAFVAQVMDGRPHGRKIGLEHSA